MPKILQLLAKESRLRDVQGTVGLLCDFAPDSPWIRRADKCYPAESLLGSPDDALAAVCPLVSTLLRSCPKLEGFQPLRVFEESLLEQFSFVAQAVNLDRRIREQGFSVCRFASHSPWLDRLRAVREITGPGYEVSAELAVLQSSPHRRALGRIWESRPTLSELWRRLSPLSARYLSGIPKRRTAKTAPSGGIWFYSTAYTFTKIGLQYEPFLPERMNYLVEDPATGGKRLQEAGRNGQLLYAWSRASDIPSSSEVRSAAAEITAAISSVPLSEEHSTLRAIFLKSEWWRLFLLRRLPFVIFNSRVLQRWFQSVAPDVILVGNAAYERTLLLHEDVRRVPAIMLQHGIMHWTYAVTDEPVDTFLLRGPFFQRLISEKLRGKTVIQNLPEPKDAAGAERAATKRDKILFITTPYSVPELFHPEDLCDILRSLLRVSHSTGRGLIIRVHPHEMISSYQESVARLQKELGLEADVDYSQGPGVEAVLKRACVAATHFSTMFLDCLRHGIPIISFDWHWFLYKRQFKEEGVFNLARDLADFEAMLKKGVDGDLPVRRIRVEDFLAPTAPEELRGFFREVWESRKSSNHGAVRSVA